MSRETRRRVIFTHLHLSANCRWCSLKGNVRHHTWIIINSLFTDISVMCNHIIQFSSHFQWPMQISVARCKNLSNLSARDSFYRFQSGQIILITRWCNIFLNMRISTVDDYLNTRCVKITIGVSEYEFYYLKNSNHE